MELEDEAELASAQARAAIVVEAADFRSVDEYFAECWTIEGTEEVEEGTFP
jgi:hypothetical protein